MISTKVKVTQQLRGSETEERQEKTVIHFLPGDTRQKDRDTQRGRETEQETERGDTDPRSQLQPDHGRLKRAERRPPGAGYGCCEGPGAMTTAAKTPRGQRQHGNCWCAETTRSC